MNLALAILTILITAGSGIFVLALFIWGAKKDGEDQASRDAELARRSRPL